MSKSESADSVHGRLLEAVHISGYTFERACSEFDWLLDEDRWKKVGQGYDDINVFLETIDLSEFKIVIEQRKSIAKKLAELQASQRATARALGVGETTIRRDLADAPNGAPVAEEPLEIDYSNNVLAPDGASAWFQDDGIDPAKLAKSQASREQKDVERAQQREENAELVASQPIVVDLASDKNLYSTIVVDPPWDWDDEGDHEQLGRGRHLYTPMSMDDLLELSVAEKAESNAHLYLWITNRSLPKGFVLLERWGFRYLTCLTWVKPSIGMGNYFRGSTEQVLFAVRGSLPLLRKDAATHFQAPRGEEHSAKPDEFFRLVESCSPGPWLDLFARKPRPGWTTYGAEIE